MCEKKPEFTFHDPDDSSQLIRSSTPIYTRHQDDHPAMFFTHAFCKTTRVYCTIEIATLHIRTPEISMIPPR